MKMDMRIVLKRLADSDQVINFEHPVSITPDLRAYLDYYGFELVNIEYYFGKIEIDGTKIMVQMFSPKHSIGTIVLLHGYLDHVGLLRRSIQHLTDHHYRVISYDLQGHGLSEGAKASVKNFSDYVATLEKLISRIKKEISGPLYGIGHSTGGSILLHYVLKNKKSQFDKIILIAPLVRSLFWSLSKTAFSILKLFPFIKEIPRRFGQNSSDDQFLSFIKKDPLQSKVIPFDWIHSLIRWNKEIQTLGPTKEKALLIQGTKDTTLEWKYNLNFIREKFLNLQVVLIENGRHQLLHEKPKIRDEVFKNIVLFLKK